MSSETKEQFREQLAKVIDAAMRRDIYAATLASEIVDQLAQLTRERDDAVLILRAYLNITGKPKREEWMNQAAFEDAMFTWEKATALAMGSK